MTQLKLLLGTLVLTAIIWVFADLASQDTASPIVAIRFIVPNTPTSVPVVETPGVRVATDPALARVRVTFGGPKVAIQKLNNDVQTGNLEFKVRVPEDDPTGRYALELVDALNQTPDVLDRGIHAISTSPSTVRVLIDQQVTVPFAVEAAPGPSAAKLDGPIVFRPETVKGTLRRSQLAVIGPATPTVVVPVEQWLRDAQGRVGPVTIPLPNTIGDIPVTFAPGQVDMSATIKSQTVLKTLSPIAVVVAINPDLLGRARVIFDDPAERIQSIDVSVPLDRAESLTPEDVFGYIDIRREDVVPEAEAVAPDGRVVGNWLTRQVRFAFPPGYEDVQIVPPLPEIRLIVVETSAGAMAPAPLSPPS
jgi:hypothetical protein